MKIILLIVASVCCGVLGQQWRPTKPLVRLPYPQRRFQQLQSRPPRPVYARRPLPPRLAYEPEVPEYVDEPDVPVQSQPLYIEEEPQLYKLPTKKPIYKQKKPAPVQKYNPVRVKKTALPLYEEPEQIVDESQQIGYEMDQDIDALKASTIHQAESQYGGLESNGAKTNNRLLFQLHGQQGPHSYRFGYDTGKGYNRQFRYEERDGYGVVKGRYGYYDKGGKLRIVNYSAHPEEGFKADTDEGSYPH